MRLLSAESLTLISGGMLHPSQQFVLFATLISAGIGANLTESIGRALVFGIGGWFSSSLLTFFYHIDALRDWQGWQD